MESNINNSSENKNDGYVFLNSLAERILFFTILTAISVGPLFLAGGFPSHADWHSHMEHAYNFKQGFFSGELLPRWVEAQTNGYGLPTFNFYGPLFYYIFTFIDLFANNPIFSNKLSYAFTMILPSITAYIYFRRHGSTFASSIATAFIIFSPAIHIFTYNTNWPVSNLSLAFVFLAFYGIDSFSKDGQLDKKNILIVSTSYTLMILSHMITAFIFTILCVPYFLLNLLIHRSKTFVKNFFLSFLIGGLLASFYIFPAIVEKKFVRTSEVLTSGIWDYTKNFLYTYLDRFPDQGFAWGIFDHRYYEVSNAIFGLIVLVCIAVLLTQAHNFKDLFNEPIRIHIAIVMFAISFLMMTPISFFIWLMIKPLQILQFPWRFTTFILPFGGVLIVYIMDYFAKTKQINHTFSGKKTFYVTLLILFFVLTYVNYINMFRWQWAPDQSLLKTAKYVLFDNAEYRPKIGDESNDKVDYKKDFSPTIYSNNSGSDVDIISWTNQKRVFQIFSTVDHLVMLRLFYFPGWQVLIDKKPVELKQNNNTGAIVFSCPPGKHEVTVIFTDTPVRKYSNYISLGALILYLMLFMKGFKMKKFTNIQQSGSLIGE